MCERECGGLHFGDCLSLSYASEMQYAKLMYSSVLDGSSGRSDGRFKSKQGTVVCAGSTGCTLAGGG